MPKYIDAEKIKWRYLPLTAQPDLFVTASDVNEMEGEDVAPVVHAHWVDDGLFSTCSNCGKYRIFPGEEYDFVYCPRCGAKMDERKDYDKQRHSESDEQ